MSGPRCQTQLPGKMGKNGRVYSKRDLSRPSTTVAHIQGTAECNNGFSCKNKREYHLVWQLYDDFISHGIDSDRVTRLNLVVHKLECKLINDSVLDSSFEWSGPVGWIISD